MSGGHFNYQDKQLKNDMFGYDHEYKNPLEDKEISNIVYDVLTLLHDFDWYKSGDTNEETYLKCKENFKKKWLRNKKYSQEVLAKIIYEETENLKNELLKMVK
jgi:hypothetical protein